MKLICTIVLSCCVALTACDSKPTECPKCPASAEAPKATQTAPSAKPTGDNKPSATAPGAALSPKPMATKGVPLTAPGGVNMSTSGAGPQIGETAPDFRLARFVPGQRIPETAQWSQGWKGKPLIVSIVPSLDTKVCELQTSTIQARYDDARYKEAAVLVTASKDLPFAMSRFAETHPGETLLYSDYKYGDLGTQWGLDVDETGLLARSVWLLDGNGKVVHREIVEDQSTEPSYDKLFAALDGLVDKGASK